MVERLAPNATPSKSRGPGYTIAVSGFPAAEKLVRHYQAEDALGEHSGRGPRFLAVEKHGGESEKNKGLCPTPSLPL